MRLRILSILLLAVVLISACTPKATVTPTITVPAATATLPPPQVQVTTAPDAATAARTFLDAWQKEDYPVMYAMLSPLTRDAIPEEQFTATYKDVLANLTFQKMEYEILSAMTNPESAQVAYRVTFHTVVVGDLTREMLMNLALDQGKWVIQWEEAMILPDLKGGNKLFMDYKVPSRGAILDRLGKTIAAQAEAVALGIYPAQIESGKDGSLLNALSNLTGLDTDFIYSLYEYAAPEWYIPVGDASAQAVDDNYKRLSGMGGLVMNRYSTRYYFDNVAPHMVGMVQYIPADEIDVYKRNGYSGSEKVGTMGLEKWAENYLAGTRGASLYVTDAQGNTLTRLGERPAVPASTVYTTFDMDFQAQVQKSLEGFRGAVVVLERDTGRVLSMVSSPGFDANLFDPGNFNSGYMLGNVLGDSDTPLLNRASQGAGYPLGSVFKIIVEAAALESGIFTPDSSYECNYEFTELDGVTLYDWTYHKEVAASGTLNLMEGLMRSCNPWFYHIGLELFRQGHGTDIANMARGFGLGSPTGIEQVAEISGNISDPTDENEAVQMAIGQGTILVNPLQVADFIAAIGNGGTLYTPQIVEKIIGADGKEISTFTPKVRGTLPISETTLSIVQESMRMVVANQRGTAHYALLGLQIPVYGKTGTAQNSAGNDHAWFAGYTNTGRTDRPDIAIAVIAENSGEGSEIAAPIFRRVVEIYYFDKPSRLYPWESTFYVTRTPTSMYSDTPEPTNAPAPTDTPEPVQEQPTETLAP